MNRSKASPGRQPTRELSERELQVLRGISNNQTYAEIAHDLKLSFETIKTYANRLRAKLGIASKSGLAVWASQNL